MSAPSIAASGTTEALLARARALASRRREQRGAPLRRAPRISRSSPPAAPTFTDAGGRTFVDYHAAYGPLILGHADPEILTAFTAAVRTVDLTGLGVTPYEIELAEKIQEHVPSAERVVLLAHGDGGDVLRGPARTRRRRGAGCSIKFQGCFHGGHDSVALNVISAARPGRRQGPALAGDPPRGDRRDADPAVQRPRGRATGARLGASRRDRGDHPRADPPQHRRRASRSSRSCEGLRTICDREGIVLVFDEVITGFRHGLAGLPGRSPASRPI